MTVIELLVWVLVTGLILGAILYVCGDMLAPPFKRAIYAICVVVLVLLVLQTFGLIHGHLHLN